MSRLRKRAEEYNTWFDRYRLKIQAFAGGGSWQSINNRMNDVVRSIALVRAIIERQCISGSLPKEKRRELLNRLKEMINLEGKNSSLDSLIGATKRVEAEFRLTARTKEDGISLGEGDLLTATIEYIRKLTPEQREVLSYINRNHYIQFGPDSPHPDDDEIGIADWFELLILFESALEDSLRVAVVSPNSKLLLMEGDLAEEVLASKNITLNTEDLNYVPHNNCFIEFSRPLKLLDYCEVVGVTICKLESLNFRSVSWVGTKSSDGENSLYPDVFSVAWIDNKEYYLLDLLKNNHPNSTQINVPSDDIEKVLIYTRNIWDFLTCRNIDYDHITRPARNFSKIKKYQHIQGLNATVRNVRILKVNKIQEVVNQEDKVPNEDRPELPYRITVPGTFHKWIYCLDCGKVHRHDLIGQPCRKCKKQVGPISNISIKKYWHREYTFGPDNAPPREIVREFQKG